MAMPVTGDSDQAIIIVARRFWAPTVSPAHQCRIELALNHSLNKFAHPIAYPSFDRIEPVVEQMNRCVGGRLRGIRLRANSGASTPDDSRLNTPETTPTSIPTTPATAPSPSSGAVISGWISTLTWSAGHWLLSVVD
jgi:hypothetical protein